MRVDRFIRNHLGKIPQGLIEKNLRSGKIKLNNKKVKSSFKVKSGDQLNLHNFILENRIEKHDNKFKPNKVIIKENDNK